MQKFLSLQSQIQQLTTPIFLVRNDMIAAANDSAKNLFISEGASIDTLIQGCHNEYRQFKKGKLFLTLEISGAKHNACVTTDGQTHIFVIDNHVPSPATSLNTEFAKTFREPLYTAVAHIDLMYNSAITANNPDTHSLLITRQKLFQMLRNIQNISDTEPRHRTASNYQFEYRDIVFYVNDCLSRIQQKTTLADLLKINTLKKKIVCYFDPNYLERALLNLVANAIKHSTGKEASEVTIEHKKDKLYITVKNQFLKPSDGLLTPETSTVLPSDPFTNPYDSGIGCGIKIARNTALEHGGSLQMYITERKDAAICEATFVMTVATAHAEPQLLRSPTNLTLERSGGYDRILIDMAELLTPEDYR